MMGGSHAISGAAAWVAITSTGPLMLGLHPLPPQGILLGAVITGGAALLPDFDHHSGTVAYSLPPLTKTMARTIAHISGGHRHGTHSLLGIAIAMGISTLLSFITIPAKIPFLDYDGTLNIGAGIVMLFCAALGLKALKLTRGSGWILPWLYSMTLAALVTIYAPDEFGWLTLAVGVGCLTHCLGDSLTVGGWPFLYPLYPKQPQWLRRIIKTSTSPSEFFNRIEPLEAEGGKPGIILRTTHYAGQMLTYIPECAGGWVLKKTLGRIWQPNGFFGVPILGTTGGWREWVFATAILSPYAMLGIGWACCDLMNVKPETVLSAVGAIGQSLFSSR